MDLTVREQRRLLAGATARGDATALQDEAVRRAVVQWPQQGRLAALERVDLDQLASVLDGVEGGLLDVQSGMTLPLNVIEDAELEVDGSHTVDVPGLAAGDAWRDRRTFVDTLPEGPVRDRLARALDGRGAFRRFSLELDRHEELIAPFLAWRDERAAGRAREWLREQGLLHLP